MPSVADLIFVALLGMLVFTPLAVKLLGDAGIGWHIRTGQLIRATYAVPRVDSFSVSTEGKPWFAWEWLYDLVMGQLEATLGLNGVVWLTGVAIAAVSAWLFHLLLQRGTNLVMALGLTLLAMSASTIHFLARPHVVSWVMTLGWFWILSSFERNGGQWHSPRDPSLRLNNGSAQDDAGNQSSRDSGHTATRRLWILPGLMVVWVNVHGGFLVGFVLLGIFWVSAVWEWWAARGDRMEDVMQRISAGQRARDLTWVGLASVAGSLVNPYGWKLHEHVFGYLTNSFLMDHVEEFQSPNFHGIAQKCFAGLVLIAFVVMAGKIPTLSRKERAIRVGQAPREVGHPKVSEMLTVLFAVWCGLYAARNIPVSSVLIAMVVGSRMLEFATGFSERMSAVQAGLRGHVWPVIAILGTFAIAANGGRVGSRQVMDAHFDPTRMPVVAVDYIVEHGLAGPVLSPDYWGGYLIYRLYGRAQVVVDDRHDLYGEEFFKSYLKMVHVEEGWREFLNEHREECLVLPRNGALANVLAETAEWKAVYEDDAAVVWVRERKLSQR